MPAKSPMPANAKRAWAIAAETWLAAVATAEHRQIGLEIVHLALHRRNQRGGRQPGANRDRHASHRRLLMREVDLLPALEAETVVLDVVDDADDVRPTRPVGCDSMKHLDLETLADRVRARPGLLGHPGVHDDDVRLLHRI